VQSHKKKKKKTEIPKGKKDRQKKSTEKKTVKKQKDPKGYRLCGNRRQKRILNYRKKEKRVKKKKPRKDDLQPSLANNKKTTVQEEQNPRATQVRGWPEPGEKKKPVRGKQRGEGEKAGRKSSQSPSMVGREKEFYTRGRGIEKKPKKKEDGRKISGFKDPGHERKQNRLRKKKRALGTASHEGKKKKKPAGGHQGERGKKGHRTNTWPSFEKKNEQGFGKGGEVAR